MICNYLKQEYEAQLYYLLESVDEEFVPPLSERIGAKHTDFNESGDGIPAYFEDLKKQELLLNVNDMGILTGFISFTDKEFEGREVCYISTVVVSKNHRNEGIATMLYNLVDEIVDAPLLIRTWSTNEKQISLLNKMGYKQVKRIENDRGNGVDTLYYIKE